MLYGKVAGILHEVHGRELSLLQATKGPDQPHPASRDYGKVIVTYVPFLTLAYEYVVP